MGNGSYSQFITCCPWISFLLRGGTPRILLLCMVLPHGKQSFTYFLHVGPYQGLQFFMIWSSTAAFHMIHPSATACSIMGSPWGHKSCQENCPSMSSSLHRDTGSVKTLLQCGVPTGSQPPSCNHLLLHGVLHWLWVDIYSPLDLRGLRGNSPVAAGESLVQCLEHLLSSPWLALVSTGLFFSHALTSLLAVLYNSSSLSSIGYARRYPRRYLVIPIYPRRCYHSHSWLSHKWALPWPVEYLSWSWLALAPSDMSEASRSFS